MPTFSSPTKLNPITTAPIKSEPTSTLQFGTKAEPTATRSEPAIGGSGYIQMLGALIFVALAVKFILPKFLPAIASKNWKIRSVSSNEFGHIDLLETKSLGGCSIHLIQIKDKSLLLTSTPNGAALVADLSSTNEPTLKKDYSFDSLLKNSMQEDQRLDSNEEAPIKDGVEAALIRLKSLTGDTNA